MAENRAEICSTDRNKFNRLNCEAKDELITASHLWNARFKQDTPFRESPPRIS
jgi:hypothetical protein